MFMFGLLLIDRAKYCSLEWMFFVMVLEFRFLRMVFPQATANSTLNVFRLDL